MKLNEFEVAERPTPKERITNSPLIKALIETAGTGKSLAIQLNAESSIKIRNRLANSLRYHGFTLHGRAVLGTLYLWADRREVNTQQSDDAERIR